MIQAICWVLIHSLWQGLLFTAITGGVVFGTKRSSAAVRYRMLCGLFFLFLFICGLTFLYEMGVGGGAGVIDAGSGDAGGTVAGVQVLIGRMSRYCSGHARVIVSGWCIIFTFKCARMATGLVYAQRVRRDRVSLAPAAWTRKVRSLARQLGIRRRVALLESGLVRIPMVIGHLRPVIFIPLGLLNHLPAGEMEAVLLHELAHIRRHDYFVHVVQHMAESLFFFNPGLLWLSALLREERENCCDDIAIARTNDRVEFVRALVSFKEHALRSGAALGFPAGKRQLLHRVLRITRQENKTLSRGERFFFLGSCLVAVVLLVSIHSQGGGGAAMRVEERPRPVKEEEVREPQVIQEPEKKKPAMGSQDAEAALEEQEIALSKQERVQQDGALLEQGGGGQLQRDLNQALKDKQAARSGLYQLQLDKLQAERAHALAELDRQQAELNRARADIEKLKLEKELLRQEQEKLEVDRLMAKKKT